MAATYAFRFSRLLSWMRPPDEIRGIARTVIEATSPALQPVAALRRFVVKSRVDVVMAPFVELAGKATASSGAGNGPERRETAPSRRSSVNGTSRRRAAT
jgi:hypothetical protein